MGSRIRAAIIAAGAGAVVLLLATHRPGALVGTPEDPTAGVVGAAAWLAWALTGYLAAAVGLNATGHLARRSTEPGPLAAIATRTAPPFLRRFVQLAVGATTAAVMAGAVPAAAYADPPHPSPAASTLDWPGLSATARETAPPVALVSSQPRRHGGPRADIVVRAGDSLWTLAARRLGPGASSAEIAAAWPRLYAANRAVIGTDPDLIRPGQRLVPPASDSRNPR